MDSASKEAPGKKLVGENMGTRRGARQLFGSEDYRKDSTTSLFIKKHKNPEQLLSQIESLYLQSQIKEVIHLIECVIDNNSDLLSNPDIFVLYSKALIEFQGLTHQSESALYQAQLLNKNSATVLELQNLFALNEELRDGLYSSAEEKLNTLLQKDPKNGIALFMLGSHLLWKTERTSTAVELLEKATKLRPHFLKAWVHLAMAYKKNHLLALADQAFQECIALDPNPNQHHFYKTHLQAL